jgi:phenylpyruvate tautomerase
MPNLSINTNVIFPSADVRNDLMNEIGKEVATIMGKPQEYMMVTLKHADITLGGNFKDPGAFCELFSIGNINNETNTAVCAKICELLQSRLNIPPARVYVVFQDIKVRQRNISRRNVLIFFLLGIKLGS